MADYYNELGLSRKASADEIKKAFRSLARKYHPDLNPEDQAAEKKFKAINEAYEILSNQATRRKYDRFGANWKHEDRAQRNYGHHGRHHSNFQINDIGDLFGGFGGSSRPQRTKPKTITVKAEVTLKEAFTGTTRTISLPGKRIEVSVPPGVNTGSIVTIKPNSEVELKVKITIKPDDSFHRVGNDLYTDIVVPITSAILGCETSILTMTESIILKIPECSQNGQKFRLSGKGMPHLKDPKRFGDLFAVLRPEMPDHISEEEREVFENLRNRKE